ncbi:MAG: hypothetical protein WC533_01190 [Candidatus Pacearchaeota archaeon]
MKENFFSEESPSKIKRAVIAGASEALKAKAKNYNKPDEEIIRLVNGKIDDILNNID